MASQRLPWCWTPSRRNARRMSPAPSVWMTEARALRIRVLRKAEGRALCAFDHPYPRRLGATPAVRLARAVGNGTVRQPGRRCQHARGAQGHPGGAGARRAEADCRDTRPGRWHARAAAGAHVPHPRRHPAGACASLLPPRSLPADHRIPQHHHAGTPPPTEEA